MHQLVSNYKTHQNIWEVPAQLPRVMTSHIVKPSQRSLSLQKTMLKKLRRSKEWCGKRDYRRCALWHCKFLVTESPENIASTLPRMTT